MSKLERRTLACGIEVRAEEGAPPKIVGHAAVFDQNSLDLGFTERVAPGAFARAIAERQDVRALWNHDPSYVLGRSAAGTLALSEDAVGLLYEIDPPDTQWARDLMASLKRGDVTQSSFSFEARTDQWRKGSDGSWTRTLLDVDLYDVSPVTFPAYLGTDASSRMRETGLYVPVPPISADDEQRNESLRARLAHAERWNRTRA
ncbi:MAG: HK97 family phage prohead protease [Candidatus Polarisedimenticolia bacterium]